MKKLILACVFTLSMAGVSSADYGPIYITTPGFCNVLEVWLNYANDIHGMEVGCSSNYGNRIVGFFDNQNNAQISQIVDGLPCATTFRTNGLVRSGCSSSSGFGINYPPTYYYGVRSADQAIKWEMQTDMPDTEATKNLPSMNSQPPTKK